MENDSLPDDPLKPPGARPASTAVSRVLVCLDRSELSESVLSHAVMLARAAGGSLTLMNVVESSGDITSESHDALNRGQPEHRSYRHVRAWIIGK